MAALLAVLAGARPAAGAIGCTLSNPAQDLKYVFPDLTTYREEVRELPRMPDGPKLFGQLRERLGSDLDPVYGTYETPYTLYTVFQGDRTIGIVHGVNVPGAGGVIQVFLSADPETGAIRDVFFQRIESPAARYLRGKEFRSGFAGLTLADFYRHDYYAAAEQGGDRDPLAKLALPESDAKGRADAAAAVRGIRKNLILLDIFVFGQRNEVFYQRARQALINAGKAAPAPAGAGGPAGERQKEETR
jgi:hypothetical protein